MKVGVVTLFPKAFDYIQEPEKSGLVGKAEGSEKVSFYIEDLRAHGMGKHKVVDDAPYGGGDGMVLKPEPLQSAFEGLSRKMHIPLNKIHKIFLDPKGELWTQKKAETMVRDLIKSDEKGDNSSKTAVILLCGRYAGVDQRFIDTFIDQTVSIGPFILNGGELPALCLIESLVRLVPDVLGNPESSVKDSFSQGLGYLIESPIYTRPKTWNELAVPETLASGDHKKINDFERALSVERTKLWFSKAIELFEDNLLEAKKEDKS